MGGLSRYARPRVPRPRRSRAWPLARAHGRARAAAGRRHRRLLHDVRACRTASKLPRTSAGRRRVARDRRHAGVRRARAKGVYGRTVWARWRRVAPVERHRRSGSDRDCVPREGVRRPRRHAHRRGADRSTVCRGERDTRALQPAVPRSASRRAPSADAERSPRRLAARHAALARSAVPSRARREWPSYARRDVPRAVTKGPARLRRDRAARASRGPGRSSRADA